MKKNVTPEMLEKMTFFLCIKVAVVLVSIIGLIATVSLFGTKIAPYMRFLPW